LPLVWWTVRSSGVPDSAIEDVVHDVFIALLGPRSAAPSDVPISRWVAGVARSVAFSHRRSHARRRARLEALPESSPTPASDELLARRRAWSELATFLHTLDDDQREAFVLVELHGASAPEVARILDAKLNTIYARVRLARGKLQRWLDGVGSRRELAAFVREAGLAGAPLPAERERGWAAVLATAALGQQGTGVATVGLAFGKTSLGWIGAAALAGVVGVGLAARDHDATPRAEAVDTESVVRAPQGGEVGSVRGEISLPSTSAVAPSTHAAAPAAAAIAPAAIAPTTSATSASAPAATERGLAEDLAWLDRADAVLQRGQAAEALAMLERHTRDVPGSPLAPERAILRVRALCALGRTQDAERLAATWRARADLPRVGEALSQTCARD
jgi:RNA polymerase sigma-70 factor (ECF subfamily)